MGNAMESARTVVERYAKKGEEKKQNGGHQLIKHVLTGERVSGVYYLKELYEKKARNGNIYTDLVLCDMSGSSFVRYWARTDIVKGSWVTIDATAEEYAGRVQIVVKTGGLSQTSKPSDLSDHLPMSSSLENDTTMMDFIRAKCEQLQHETNDSTCYILAEDVLGSAKTFGRFIRSPYGIQPHYGVVGGLLAHTMRVAKGVLNLAEQYNLLPKELQIALCAALLHAVGAVDAYTMDECVSAETEHGILLGTEVLTVTRLALRVQALREEKEAINSDIVLRILHCVSSCNSRVLPMTKEALVVHQAYQADMELVNALDFIARDENAENDFTAFDPMNGRRYYKK